MNASTWVSLASAIIAALAAVVASVLARRAVVRDRRLAADELAGRYRVPLLHAAFNLQTRLYNIGRQDFLRIFLSNGSASDADYARYNTVYLIGQFLCWAEILRREVQLLEPLNRGRDQDIMTAMENVRYLFADSRTYHDPVLRVFRGDQRAVGEVLLTAVDSPADRIGPRWECIGYAAFVEAVSDQQNSIRRWMDPLIASINELATDYQAHSARLIELQHGLVELINLIDPEGQRIPTSLRDLL
jgi:hypothetical protein